jgi:hypothetical protein
MSDDGRKLTYPSAREQKQIRLIAENFVRTLDKINDMDLVRLDMFAWATRHNETSLWARNEVYRVVHSRFDCLADDDKVMKGLEWLFS